MTKINELMTPDPYSLKPDDLVIQKIDIFDENRIHHLPVLGSDNEVVGMVSNKDFDNYLNIMKAMNNSDHPLLVREIMTTPVFSYFEDVDVKQAARAMVDNNIHAIIVVNRNEEMVGILTSTDLLRYLAEL